MSPPSPARRASSHGAPPRRVVRVEVAPPYEAVVGSGVLAEAARVVGRRDVALIADADVAARHGDAAEAALAAGGARVRRYEAPAGEGAKSVAVWAGLLSALARDGLDRTGVVAALGGGVAGDLAGFVAASYLRGVAFLNLPTSSLAMADAAIGGKTGLNLPEGKNLVGAFWRPERVLMDVDLLATLPERTFLEGAVEAFKHGLLDPDAGPGLLAAIADPAFRPGGDPDLLVRAFAASAEVKARIVAADEREAGRRAWLNLGHTLAHALEKGSGHALTHGAAVAYGLAYAALLARGRGFEDLVEPCLAYLARLDPLPLREALAGAGLDALEPFLARDKKAVGGTVRFVLLRRRGDPALFDDVTAAERRAAWDALLEATS